LIGQFDFLSLPSTVNLGGMAPCPYGSGFAAYTSMAILLDASSSDFAPKSKQRREFSAATATRNMIWLKLPVRSWMRPSKYGQKMDQPTVRGLKFAQTPWGWPT
jgi:hypothetical protein